MPKVPSEAGGTPLLIAAQLAPPSGALERPRRGRARVQRVAVRGVDRQRPYSRIRRYGRQSGPCIPAILAVKNAAGCGCVNALRIPGVRRYALHGSNAGDALEVYALACARGRIDAGSGRPSRGGLRGRYRGEIQGSRISGDVKIPQAV